MDHRNPRSTLRSSQRKWEGLYLPQASAMAAAVWTIRGRKAVLGTVVRSTSTHASLKSEYDALVVGGGENCGCVCRGKMRSNQELAGL